jgi:hypothetical protein
LSSGIVFRNNFYIETGGLNPGRIVASDTPENLMAVEGAGAIDRVVGGDLQALPAWQRGFSVI